MVLLSLDIYVVASGLLSWGHFISNTIIDLIAQILFKLDDAITKFNNEMIQQIIEC